MFFFSVSLFYMHLLHALILHYFSIPAFVELYPSPNFKSSLLQTLHPLLFPFPFITHWVQRMIILCTWQLGIIHWIMYNLPWDPPQKETHRPSFRDHQLPVGTQLEVKSHECLSLSALILCSSCASSHSGWQLIWRLRTSQRAENEWLWGVPEWDIYIIHAHSQT